MSEARFSAVPPYARDVVPGLGWTLFAGRAAWPALSGTQAMTTTHWVLAALLGAVALFFFSRAARAEWVRVEGDELTRWSPVRGWRKERRPLTSVRAAAPVARGTAIGFEDGVVWLVPASYRGGEALGRWAIGHAVRADVQPSA